MSSYEREATHTNVQLYIVISIYIERERGGGELGRKEEFTHFNKQKGWPFEGITR